MKKITFLVIFLIGIFWQITYSQEVILQGRQYSEKGSAQLKSDGVYLSESYKIIRYETNASSFWIENKNTIFKAFEKNKYGKFVPNPIGFILPPGNYKVFPNLNNNQKERYIKLYLIPVRKKR